MKHNFKKSQTPCNKGIWDFFHARYKNQLTVFSFGNLVPQNKQNLVSGGEISPQEAHFFMLCERFS